MDKMNFCYVPMGPFLMGSPDKDEMAFDDEKPLHQLDLAYGYWLARYPITVAQFTTFAEESGYFPRDDEPLRGLPRCPVVYINLRDAQAFCRWLDGLWRQQGIIPAGWSVTLPNEAEWEKGARGGLDVPVTPLIKSAQALEAWQPEVELKVNDDPKRRYPWGDWPESRLANYDQAGINRASVIGRFPKGVSPYGCEEMSGNVREWTRSHYKEYPYNSLDGRESSEYNRDTKWVLRGGSFNDFARSIRCSIRFPFKESRSSSFGFRLVVVPFATSKL